ncbi:MAG: hypothetical protein ACM3PO_02890 [Betaproteobacteria bacterium]
MIFPDGATIISSGLSNQFTRSYQQTKSQQRVGLLPHSFLLLESVRHADDREALIQRPLWLPSCRDGNKVRTTISPADGSLWSSVGNRISSNFCNSGRWRHYCTHAQFLDEMRNVQHLRNQWAWLAGLAVSEQTNFQQIELQPNLKQSIRHKQEFGAQQATPLSHSALGQRRRPASAILAAVAGRL